jgi:hypothetical protein
VCIFCFSYYFDKLLFLEYSYFCEFICLCFWPG